MSDNDPTTKLPDDESKYDTKPGITTVLERINQFGEQIQAQLNEFRAEMTKRLQEIETRIDQLRADTTANFDKFDRKLDVLHGDIIDM